MSAQPHPRSNEGGAVYDAHRRKVVAVTVPTPGELETWTWDGERWERLETDGNPGYRSEFSLAYDEAHQNVVLYGGVEDTSHGMDDTWILKGTTWRQVDTPHSADLRYGAAMAYDPVRGEVVIFGGSPVGGFYEGRTFAFDGAAWHQVAVSGPQARVGAHMAYDVNRGRLVLFGGRNDDAAFADTWVWTGIRWQQLDVGRSPPTRYYETMAPTSGGVAVFGGVLADYTRTLHDTWVLAAHRWKRLHIHPAPQRRIFGTLAFDGAHDENVLFGGHGKRWFGGTWVLHHAP